MKLPFFGFRRKRQPTPPPQQGQGDRIAIAGESSIAIAGPVIDSEIILQAKERLKKQVPALPPDVPRLHILIGRRDEQETLLTYYDLVRREGRGKVAILTGRKGSGRHALIQWLQTQVMARGGAVAATLFFDRRWIPSDRQSEVAQLYWDSKAMKQHAPSLMKALTAEEKESLNLDPILSMLTQLVEQGKFGDAIPPTTPEGGSTLSYLVRRVTASHPLLLSIEYLEHADQVWLDELRSLAAEAVQELPLLLVLSLTTPASLREIPFDEYTPAQKIAALMLDDYLAFEFHLDRVTAEEVSEALATTPELGQVLSTMAAGDPYIVESLFQEWRRHHLIRKVGQLWEFTRDSDDNWRVYGDTREYVNRSLYDLVAGRTDSPDAAHKLVERLKAILQIGALEGEIFTAEAVAEVLDAEAAEVRSLCERYLCAPPEAEDRAADRYFLRRMGETQLPHGLATRYRFTRPYLHHAFGSLPRGEVQYREQNRRLAQALQRLHYPLHGDIADTLYRLYRAAGATREALKFLRRRTPQELLSALRNEVNSLRRWTPLDSDRVSVYRLFSLGFQLCGLLASTYPQFWEEGYELASDLLRRAEAVGDREYQADALYCQAWHLEIGGRYREALPPAREAVARYTALHGDESAPVGRALNNLGRVLYDLGDLTGARAAFERALAIAEAVYGPEHPNVATAVNNLGGVLWKLGDLAGARAAFEQAMAIFEKQLGPEHPHVATLVNNLGLVLQGLGDLAGARAALERALKIDEAVYGPEHPEVASNVNNLGLVLRDLGDLAGARAALERALAILERSQLPPEHPLLKIVRRNLLRVKLQAGDVKPDEIIALLRGRLGGSLLKSSPSAG